MPAKKRKSLFIVNTFGVLGYLSCILQWLWVSALFLPALFANESVRVLLLPDEDTTRPSSVVSSSGEPNMFLMIIAIVVTLLVVIAAGVILARLPLAIAKTGKKAVVSATRVVVPVITHHQKLPPKKEKRISAVVQMYLKFAACVIPALLIGLVYIVPISIDQNIGIIVACLLGIGSVFWFAVEYLSAYWLKIPQEKIL